MDLGIPATVPNTFRHLLYGRIPVEREERSLLVRLRRVFGFSCVLIRPGSRKTYVKCRMRQLGFNSK
eukprot:scaffold145_cov173-Amphora_coffeaeformis.AAC.11